MTLTRLLSQQLPSLADRAALRWEKINRRRQAKALEAAAKAAEVTRPYTPHRPSPKQLQFLSLTSLEALYGGAAGGGKSDALIHDALSGIEHPRYSGLILRKVEKDLWKAGNIGDRVRSWLAGTAAKWNAEAQAFTFPSGAKITLGHLTTKADQGRWKGPEFQRIEVDELTEWEEENYLFLFSRLRPLEGLALPSALRAATNPGGPGHEWVYERFVRWSKRTTDGMPYDDVEPQSGVAATDGWRKRRHELSADALFVSPPTPQAIEVAKRYGKTAQGAYFVPAFQDDNPGIKHAEYAENLARLDAVLFAWYSDGDWKATRKGGYFEGEWFKYLDEAPRSIFWIRYWDLAGTVQKDATKDPDKFGPAWTAGVRIGIWLDLKKPDVHSVVIGNVQRRKLNPPEVEEFVKEVAEQDGRRVQVIFEQEPGQAGKAEVIGFQRRLLPGYSVFADKVSGAKELYWKALANFAKAGGVYLVRGEWNADFVRELTRLPAAKKDQADAASRGYAWLTGDEGKRLTKIWALANAG
jgi:predicted phage terminase large subunit-like protein